MGALRDVVRMLTLETSNLAPWLYHGFLIISPTHLLGTVVTVNVAQKRRSDQAVIDIAARKDHLLISSLVSLLT